MLKIILVVSVLHLFKVRGTKLEPFDEDADGLMKTILGDISNIKHTYAIRNITQNETKVVPDHEEKSGFLFSNQTKEEYEMKKLLELIHDNSSSIIPDFENDVDEIQLATRRLERTKNKNPRKEELLIKTYKNLHLVQQFVYETRNRLPYAQMLRKKYKDQLRYKVGYLLALVRNLKRLQMVLYNSYVQISEKIDNYILHILVFEKVLRLDVDIKDVIKFIKKLNKQRKEEEDPKDYDNDDSNGNLTFPFLGMGGKNLNGNASILDHAPGGLVPGGAMSGGAMPGGPMPEGPIAGGPMPGGPIPGGPMSGGPIDNKKSNFGFMNSQWRRMDSRSHKPRNEDKSLKLWFSKNLGRKIVNPYVSAKRARNRLQLWSASNKMKKSHLDYKSLYT